MAALIFLFSPRRSRSLPVAMKEDGAFLGERLRRGTVGDDDLAAV
jgi:hypothetical protein